MKFNDEATRTFVIEDESDTVQDIEGLCFGIIIKSLFWGWNRITFPQSGIFCNLRIEF